MRSRSEEFDEADFRRLARVKQSPEPPASCLGPEMISFFKQSVQKRQTKFSKIASAWSTLVPQALAAHCALDSFSKGSLTVLVDSAPHLYEMKQLLLAGLQQQLVLACANAGLKKIMLKSGRWYEGDGGPSGKIRF